MSQRNLTAKDILQKEFKPALRGFNTAEVDEYLDLIIRDYESYDKEIAYLKNENERLKRQLSHQEESNTSSPTTSQRSSSEVENTTNYDILKRLSRLEKTVYGQSRTHDKSEQQTQKEDENDTKIYRKREDY